MSSVPERVSPGEHGAGDPEVRPATGDRRRESSGGAFPRELRSAAITLLAVAGIELFSRTPLYNPDLYGIVALTLVAVVVASAARGGLFAGVISATIAVLYNFYFLWIPGEPFHLVGRDLRRAIIVGSSLPPLALVVGYLRQRIDRLVLRERALREEAEAARAKAEGLAGRSAFLADASRTLASSLEFEDTLQRVAHLAVPTLADYCIVDLVGAEREIRRVATAHRDPRAERLYREIQRRYPPDPGRSPLARVLRTGEPLLLPEVAEEWLETIARNEEHKRLIRDDLGTRSVMTVPLVARGQTVGIMTYGTTRESERRFGQADLGLAQEVADRAAVAIDNARLYREVTAARGEAEELVEELQNQTNHLEEQAVELEALNSELGAAEGRLRGIIDSALDALIVTDSQGVIVEWNHCAETIFGWSADEAVGKSLSETIIPSQYRESHQKGVERYLATGQGSIVNRRIEITALARDGREFPVELAVAPVHAGSQTLFTAFVRDITERKRAEEHYRSLVETSPDGIFVLDTEGRFTEVNEAALDILRMRGRVSKYLGHHFSELLVADDVPKKAAAQQAKLSGVKVTDTEVRVRAPSGEDRLVHMRSTLIKEEGQVVGTLGIVRDITEERAREQTMRLLTAALESFDAGISLLTTGWSVRYANAAWARILGVEREAMPELDLRDLLPDEAAREQAREIQHALTEQGQWSGRVWRRRVSDGRVIPLDLLAGAVDAPSGERNLFVVVHEASEAIEHENQTRRVERLASLGTLIGGVAHELNNPLHAIRNFAELMLMTERDSEDRESLEIVKHEADRAAKVVSDLRLIARETQEDRNQRTHVDLNDLVLHVLKLRRYSLETGNVEIREDLAHDLPPVRVNRGEIEQVVLNLVINAEQAMASQAGERRLILRTRRTQRGASVHVVDNGSGIPARHLDRIFDPFFTTKRPGEGTGLGLSLAYSIISEHGGEIQVDSEPGKGTAFRIDLPTAPAADEHAPEESSASLPVRSLRILLVDDEDAIRRVTVRFLERRGHHVDEAREGGAALRLLESADYDVIISDLRMPGVGGEELFFRLQEQGQGRERRVIFMTGDAASGQTARIASEANVPMLLKPVRLEDLARVVEAIGSGSSQAG